MPEKSDEPRVRVLSKASELHTYQPTVTFLKQEDEYSDLLR